MDEDLLFEIRKKGLLLEKVIYDLLDCFKSKNDAKVFLEQLERISGQKMITSTTLKKNASFVQSFVTKLGTDDKKVIEKVIFNLGINFELRSEKEVQTDKETLEKKTQDYKIFYADTRYDKKLEVKDFTRNLRARYQQIQRILMARSELQNNLVSIGKISTARTSLSIIAIVKDKRITKNRNLILTLEDLTGEITALVKVDKDEVFAKAEELLLDDIIGIKASGNRELLFVHDVIYPDVFLHDKKRFEKDECIAFLSDVHAGSDRHLKKSMENFLFWINGDDPVARKIKYIFFVGDNVDGVGIFPGQERVLELKSMEKQYELLASYLKRIPKHITMFMCPGQHDAVRVAEPQPIIGRRYANVLYDIENLILVTNPSMIKLIEGDKEFKVLMYHGASIHYFINEIKTLRVMKAHSCPAKAVCQMLKRRHLAPTHSSVVYIPNAEADPLVIDEVPDVLCTGEVHRLDIENYNGVLILTGSCWQAQTDFEEKVGNIPNPGKVSVLNLKTRELKIFDFLDKEEAEHEY